MGISSSLGSSALLPAGLGFRNLIINGAMQIAQRNTSVASITTGGYYTADRYTIGASSIGTWTQSVENDAPTGSGFRKSLKMLCTTADASPAAGDYLLMRQLLEGQNLQQIKKGTTSAQQMYLSFWVKANVSGTYILEIEDTDNSRAISKSYVVNAINTWEYKTIEIPADATGTLDNDNAASLAITWWLASGSTYTSGTLATSWAGLTSANRAVGQVNLASATNNYWQITGVQLEANYQPTPFEQRPIGVELALCQRYYEKSYDLGTAPATVTETGVHRHSGSGNASGRHYVPIRFKVEKRANDYTVTTYDPTAAGSTWVTANPSQAGLQRTPLVENKGTSGMVLNVEDGGYSWNVGNTRGHWSVSSEL